MGLMLFEAFASLSNADIVQRGPSHSFENP